MSEKQTHPLSFVYGLMIFVGFPGAVLSGMAWALCEGVGWSTAWPKGLTLMFAVPFLAAFVMIQFTNFDRED